MIYRSNLTCPDLSPHFKHLWTAPAAFNHDVPHDWADKSGPEWDIWKRCGFWTHDEAAILYNVAKILGPTVWADIGANVGWTTAHISAATNGEGSVDAVEPEFHRQDFVQRFAENSKVWDHRRTVGYFPYESGRYFDVWHTITAACIDGNHDSPEPLKDAQGANRMFEICEQGRYAYADRPKVVMFHDFIGKPVQDAVVWLLDQGYQAKIYCTPQMVACCWRGDFEPPAHVPDQQIVDSLPETRMPEFPFHRVRWWK